MKFDTDTPNLYAYSIIIYIYIYTILSFKMQHQRRMNKNPLILLEETTEEWYIATKMGPPSRQHLQTCYINQILNHGLTLPSAN